jgi:hypothetical protein
MLHLSLVNQIPLRMKRMIRPFGIPLLFSMTRSREFDGDADPVRAARVKEMLLT